MGITRCRYVMNSRRLLMIFVAGCAALNCAAPAAASSQSKSLHPATLEDVLSVEGVGAAGFTPDGRWLIYTLLPPYSEISDFSYSLNAFGRSGHQIWIYDLKGQKPPTLQPGLDASATNFLLDLSPDGMRLVVLEYKLGRYRFVVCRIGRPDCIRYEEMPDIQDRYVTSAQWNERPVWISTSKFVVPTRSPELPGTEMRNRTATGRFLASTWEHAWTGDHPTASEVVSTQRDRSEDWAEGQLTLFDIKAGTSRKIATGRFTGLTTSPDKQYVIAARLGTRIRPSAEAEPIPRETHPIFDRRHALVIFEVETWNARFLDAPFNIDPNSFTWKPNGNEFAVYGWSKGESSEDGGFYAVTTSLDVQAFETPQDFIFANNRFSREFPWFPGPARAAYLPDGLAVYGYDEKSGLPTWMLISPNGTNRTLSPRLGDNSREIINADAESITVIGPKAVHRYGEKQSLQTLFEASHEDRLRSLSFFPNMSHGWSLEFRDSPQLIREPFPRVNPIVVQSPDANEDRAVVFVRPDAYLDEPVSVTLRESGARVIAASLGAKAVLVSVKDRAATKLLLITEQNDPLLIAELNEHLNQILPAKRFDFNYVLQHPEKPFLTHEMEGCLLLPPRHKPGQTHPILVDLYPIGRTSKCNTLSDVPTAGFTAPELWTSRGFIYFRPALPLDLLKTSQGPIDGIGAIADQTIDAVSRLGVIDEEKIVFFGFSQGAVIALSAAVQSRRPSATIALNGWTDFQSHYFGPRGLMRYFHLDENGGDNRWRYECRGEGRDNTCRFGFGATPFETPMAYTLSSPVIHANEIESPVLLVHSDLDYFDMSQFDEMFGALYRAGKEATYVRYWGEGHGPSSPANIRDYWMRVDRFLNDAGVCLAECTDTAGSKHD